jgi:acetyl-CoA synthetase
MPEKSELLTVEEVSKRLKLTPLTIRRMLNDGRLRGTKVGRVWRVFESEVDRLLRGGKDPNAHV